MGFLDKVKDFVAPSEEDEEEEEEYVEEKPARPAKKASAQPKQQSRNEKQSQNVSSLSEETKMVLFEPRSFGEAEEAGTRLKEGRAVVVNLHKLDRDYAQRTIDFLTGVVFALDGNIQRIGQNVILCYPAEIGVSGSISLGPVDEEVVEEEELYIS